MLQVGTPPLVGDFSIEIDIPLIQLLLIGEASNGTDCAILVGQVEFGPAISAFDNVVWEAVISEENGNLGIDLNINCSTPGLLSFDYALLTPTPTASLDNQLLFVNYTDSTIVLEGQWQDFVPTGGPGKSSAITGATMKFPFTGWNITLLGYFDPTVPGNITLGVSLDEQTPVQLEFAGEMGGFAEDYFEYFTFVQQESNSGNHTITIEIQDASLDQIVGFCGFTYIPGFATLNDMPDFPAVSASAVSSSTSISSPTSSTPSLGGSVQSHQEALHGKTIAGVVVGAIAGICLIELILWVAWRRIKRRRTLSPAQAWVESTSGKAPSITTGRKNN
ncbi:hypothetical protein BDP27DRAFT_1426574 [Rhodocollybia butyracea]|uniref:Uncharacterized protein n=1 Tax=Rhodocollybia butyracea TaxID=206335 RepID=A0A9P5PEG1_9AGAR|nr:hypothetical protein BDP27DRAFT_1426574 [Rhodocollybia butyracea]